MLYKHVTRNGVLFTVFLHVNNKAHWLENYEVWAALGDHDRVSSQNGYVQPPWKRVSSKYIELNPKLAGWEAVRELDARLESAFLS